MRTNIIPFVLVSENRKLIVKTMLDYPKRQWSCSALEDLTNIPHATVFRALKGLKELGALKSIKLNRKDIAYELVYDSPLLKELEKIINIEKLTANKIANDFIRRIKAKNIKSAVLYGSGAGGELKSDSDIDILIVLDKHIKSKEEEIQDIAADFSSKLNRTISVNIMDAAELKKEKDSQFIKSVQGNMELLYGKKLF